MENDIDKLTSLSERLSKHTNIPAEKWIPILMQKYHYGASVELITEYYEKVYLGRKG